MLLSGATAPLCAQAEATPMQQSGVQTPTVRPDQQAIVPPLRRLVTLDFRDARLEAVLDEIDRQARIGLQYTSRTVPVDKRVSIKVKGATVSAALGELLRGTGVEAVSTELGEVMLVKRSAVGTIDDDTVAAAAGTVFGVVTDSASGEPVPNVMVSVKGTAIRASTSERGQYQLREVPRGPQVIVTRLLGYLPLEKEVTVTDDNRTRADFALRHGLTRLQEVVTTATGRQRRLELGNDITVINADSVVRAMPITSVTDLLETRVPGLLVQRTSGAPGDPARLRLRGASSPLRSNDPIVVMDGIRIHAEQSSARSANLAGLGDTTRLSTNAYATPSPLDYIDPNSIETIEVIKGPSAATLYGQDAANGVIVITTKRGHAGPARWTASGEHGRTQMAGAYPDLLLRWGHPPDNSLPVICPISNTVEGQVDFAIPCQGDSVVTFQLLNDPALTVLDRGQRTGLTLGVSGGTSSLTYAVNGSYQDELGLVKLPTYEADRYQRLVGASPPAWMRRPQQLTQWGATSRLTAQLGTSASLSLSASLSRTEQQRSSLEQQLGSLMSTYLERGTGTYYATDPSLGVQHRYAPLSGEQVLRNYYERATAAATQFTNGVNLNWPVLPWLTLAGDAGLNVQQRADEIFLPHLQFTTGDSIGGSLAYGQGNAVVSTLNLRVASTAPLGRGFQFRFAAGANYTGRSISDLSGRTSELAAGTSLLGAVIDGLQRGVQDDATYGWYVAPALSNRRFWLDLGLRLDGGSTYGARVTLPKFPKIGLSYLLSDEPFYPLKDLLPTLRLRAAYGRAGRQPGVTDRLRVYGETRSIWGDGRFAPGVELERLGNTKLRPEQSTELEGGFDADLLNNGLSVGITGYRKTTDDFLLDVPVAPSVYGRGMTFTRNVGALRNTGLEFTVDAQLLRSAPVTWGTHLSVSQNRNMVVKLGPGVDPFYTSMTGSSGTRVAPGYPLFGRWSRPILGYADANGNGVLENAEIQLGDTLVYVGQQEPNYTANLHTTVSLWRGAMAVMAGFSYQDGLSQKNEVAQRLAPFSRGRNEPGVSLPEQIAVADLISATDYSTSDYNWFQTVSMLRFNSLAVTYNVPSSMAQRVGARALSLSLQGTNLGLRTNYRGLDPNVNAFATGNNVTDTGVLPQPRTWQVRVNASY